MTDTTPTTEPKVVISVVWLLGAIALAGISSYAVLVAIHVPAVACAPILAIGSGAAGSLGTMLASTRSGDPKPPPPPAGNPPNPQPQVDGSSASSLPMPTHPDPLIPQPQPEGTIPPDVLRAFLERNPDVRHPG